MSWLSRVTNKAAAAAGIVALLLIHAPDLTAQRDPRRVNSTAASAAVRESAGRVFFLKAFVIDDRLSALRREPGLKSEVIRRLRLGHTVFIVNSSKSKGGQPRFCRVAVTRRTRGWIHESALAVQSRAGEDRRILKLIEAARDGVDKIVLCEILIERFGQSRLVPRALFLLAEEAERAAEILSQRTRRRLADVNGSDAGLQDYYLSDASLDRYSRLRVVFDFNDSTGEFVYDGRAYREIIRRFPTVSEAGLARQRLELATRKMARRQ
ncbi:MAG: SH3 domain-containing protein [Blastocatellia bacterium]